MNKEKRKINKIKMTLLEKLVIRVRAIMLEKYAVKYEDEILYNTLFDKYNHYADLAIWAAKWLR